MSTLMYVKEDLIIPNHISFYDLISTKARGKSGPLFHFDVHEDIRMQHDARIEKDESHAGRLAKRLCGHHLSASQGTHYHTDLRIQRQRVWDLCASGIPNEKTRLVVWPCLMISMCKIAVFLPRQRNL